VAAESGRVRGSAVVDCVAALMLAMWESLQPGEELVHGQVEYASSSSRQASVASLWFAIGCCCRVA